MGSIEELDECHCCDEDYVDEFMEDKKNDFSIKFTKRLKSLQLALQMPLDEAALFAKAGFYYHENPGRLKCFSCYLILNEWDKTMDPWITHAFWNPSCLHVKDKKGEKFIQNVVQNWKKFYLD